MVLFEDQAQELSVEHTLLNVLTRSPHLRQVVLRHNRNDKEELQRAEVISPHSLTEGVTKQESFSETC